MTDKDLGLLERVDLWVVKLNDSLDQQVKLRTKSDPKADINDIKNQYIVNKIAVLTVAVEELGERLKILEKSSVQADTGET